MSQSPLSPVGKRLKRDSDSSSNHTSPDEDVDVASVVNVANVANVVDLCQEDWPIDDDDEEDDDYYDDHLGRHLFHPGFSGIDNHNQVANPDVESNEIENSSYDSDDSLYHEQNIGLRVNVDGNPNGIEAYILGDSDVEDDDDDYEYGIDDCTPEEYLKHDPTPEKPYPRPTWLTLNELRRRKNGLLPSRNMCWFEKKASDSLWMIQRLMITKHLNEHTGSVNCIDFNTNGRLLCSGSDDLNLCIWDWERKKLRKKINTYHTNNVFHSQFCNSDQSIVTSSRDGSVRLMNIETGETEQLLNQSGEIGKLAFITPQTLVTCGTNACVNFIDLRTRIPERLFIARSPKNNRSCSLHTIDSHPLDKHKIVVAGDSPYVFLYDLRRVAHNPDQAGPIYCLDNDFDNTTTFVTSTVFNSTGDLLLISYNDDDLYVCRTDKWNFIHRYKGHRNEKTIKGCAWFGENFVLSGSDDGYVYGWDLESEHIVCFQKGNTKGAVNYLTVHPTLPILASSGIDHDVKVWEPSSSDWPQTMKNIKPIICMNTMRRNRDKLRGMQMNVNRALYGDDESDESE